MLDTYAKEEGLDIRLSIKILNGGHRSSMVEKAIKAAIKEDQGKPKSRRTYIRAIFLDTDNATEAEISELTDKLKANHFIAIWQKPNHEAFLWRHFNKKYQKPPDPGKVKEDIKQFFPGYKKGCPADDLKRKIDLPKIIKVAHSLENEGDDGFINLLKKIGFDCQCQ